MKLFFKKPLAHNIKINTGVFLVLFFILLPQLQPAFGYIGPGAGFAVLSSFLMMFIAFLLAAVNLITWPLRYIINIIRGKNAYKNASTTKVVVLGLDGLDPDLVQKYISEDKLPNLKKLQETGHFSTLGTTFPAISPVAWSSFQTGVNPGKHNIFDFLKPDWKTYFPTLSSTSISSPFKHILVGKYKIPLGKPSIRLLRKSKPFWNILNRHGIFTNILRVPITFPPEKSKGLLLSAMCVPDLRGSQGSFTYFTSNPQAIKKHTGGKKILIDRKNGVFKSVLPGPTDPLAREARELKIPFSIEIKTNNVLLEINGNKILLKQHQYSDWVKLQFKTGFGIKINGICRFLLKEIEPELELYVTPINIDPEKPSMPISDPPYYATYLTKLQGSYATLGLAEDTWALNEGLIDEAQFLQQTYDIHKERETMFFNALERLEKGLLTCVFDATDRIQHTFMRYLDSDHPANKDKNHAVYKDTIENVYKHADDLIGKVLDKIDDNCVLFIISDHGFKSFRRGVNLNAWLYKTGYLKIKENSTEDEWFNQVDWSGTKAYALGLGGIYLNRKDREELGIVATNDLKVIKNEIMSRLSGLFDNELGKEAIKEVYDSSKIMKGPYLDSAPDLIVGYNPGYRASWGAVTGTINEPIFTDNIKAWSGDHCIDPRQVPGILFSNKRIKPATPHIYDLAPTILTLFGITPPSYMDGTALKIKYKE